VKKIKSFWENGCNGVEEGIMRKEVRMKIHKCHEKNHYRRRNRSPSTPVDIPTFVRCFRRRKRIL
jgi:hypothetical protein